MELIEELLDEENEKILNKLDNAIGLSNNKSILRDIVKYHKVMQDCTCDIEFENYNIVIRNESNYIRYEDLISVIAQVYYKNGITLNPNILYFSEEDFKNYRMSKDKENEMKILESIIVIDLNNIRRNLQDMRKDIESIILSMPEKAFIILENYYCEGQINAILTEYFSWSMKIETISTEEKEKYARKFLDSNNLTYNDETIKQISDNPYYKVRTKLINTLVNCKINEETNVAKVLNIEDKTKEKKKTEKTGMQQLDELVGLDEVKEQIKKVIYYIKTSKNRKNMPMLHMSFNGNPGTGKTTVARILGKIFAEEKILSDKEIFVEAQRCDMIGKYVGHTAPMTQKMIDKSLGGVLFIDEAYSISTYIQDEAGRDYGAECIATLLKGMEDNKDNLCVILAGYTKEMEHMLSVNPGFESRIQFKINFPDYSSDDLYTIFKELCKKENYKLSNNIRKLLISHFEEAKKLTNFSNARYVRNLYEKVKFEQAYRISNEKNSNIDLIKKCDIESILKNIKPVEMQKIKIGFSS